MKRDMDFLDLRNAFSPIPDSCRDALMQAARSVKEEEKMKRVTMRTLLIAALIIIATTAAAMAAGSIFGWNDFYGLLSKDTTIPQKAQDVLNATEEKQFTVGNIQFTVRELLCDGYMAMSSTSIRTADGSAAMIVMDPFSNINAIGENGDAYAARLGVKGKMSPVDAARKLGIPLYTVRAILEVAPDQFMGEQMEEALWDEENSLVYFSLIDDLIPDALQGDVLHAQLFLRVTEYDTETAAEISKEAIREDIDLPISAVLEEADYTPEAKLTVNGLTLESVHATHTVAGAYLETVFTAANGVETDDFYALPEAKYLDAEGHAYGFGMNMSIPYNIDRWPTVSMTFLISVDELPETLRFQMAGQEISLMKDK